MAIAYVNSDADFNAATTSLTLTITPSAIGNLLVVGVDCAADASGVGSPAVSDTGGHTWNVCNEEFLDGPHHQTLASWYTLATTTSSITLTLVSNKPSDWISAVVDQFSGVHQTNPLDVHVESLPEGSASNPAVSSAMVPSVDNELVWAWCVGMISATGNIDGVAADAGGDTLGDDRTEYRILTGRSGVSMTATCATYSPFKYNILSATFRPDAYSRDARVVVRRS